MPGQKNGPLRWAPDPRTTVVVTAVTGLPFTHLQVFNEHTKASLRAAPGAHGAPDTLPTERKPMALMVGVRLAEPRI